VAASTSLALAEDRFLNRDPGRWSVPGPGTRPKANYCDWRVEQAGLIREYIRGQLLSSRNQALMHPPARLAPDGRAAARSSVASSWKESRPRAGEGCGHGEPSPHAVAARDREIHLSSMTYIQRPQRPSLRPNGRPYWRAITDARAGNLNHGPYTLRRRPGRVRRLNRRNRTPPWHDARRAR
jgi:hypothetical protein